MPQSERSEECPFYPCNDECCICYEECVRDGMERKKRSNERINEVVTC